MRQRLAATWLASLQRSVPILSSWASSPPPLPDGDCVSRLVRSGRHCGSGQNITDCLRTSYQSQLEHLRPSARPCPAQVALLDTLSVLFLFGEYQCRASACRGRCVRRRARRPGVNVNVKITSIAPEARRMCACRRCGETGRRGQRARHALPAGRTSLQALYLVVHLREDRAAQRISGRSRRNRRLRR